MRPRSFHLLIAAALGLCGACSSAHWYDYSFSPAPLEVAVSTGSESGAQVRTLVSVLGVARGGDEKPDHVEVRMRFENLGTAPAKLHTDSFTLFSADLQEFGKPVVIPPEVPILEGGSSASVDLAFPFPKGKHPSDLNLRGLDVSWAVSFGEHRVTAAASFMRSDWRTPYDDYPRAHAGVPAGYTSQQ